MGLSRSQRFVFMRRMKLIEVSRLTCGGWQVEIVISPHLIPHLSRAQCADGLAGTRRTSLSSHPWLHLKSARSAAVNAQRNRTEELCSIRSVFIRLILFVLLLFVRVGPQLEIAEHEATLLFYFLWLDHILIHNQFRHLTGFCTCRDYICLFVNWHFKININKSFFKPLYFSVVILLYATFLKS